LISPFVGVAEDYLKLGDNIIRQEISNMMKHLGYGNQPYFVYKHKDLERVHFHIVSTRIDRETGRKIKDNFEKKKMQEFIKNLEQKYQLTQTEKKEIPDFKFSPRSRNIKQNLENLFKHLNQVPEITSKEMYSEALKLFNVEIRKSGRGHIVVVTDDIGNPIRYPIRLSNFKEGPKFYVEQIIGRNQKIIVNRMHQLLPENNRIIELTLKSIVLKGLLLKPETKANKKTTQIRNQKKYKKKW
jgi:hypothetical protein